jgi:hypothetical protein
MGLPQPKVAVGLALGLLIVAGTLGASRASARVAGDPVRLQWQEGDVAGFASIGTPDGEAIGFVEYTQSRRDGVLTMSRVARFADGSSDEDTAEAEVGTTLRALRGRSIIRDASGRVTVDLGIDVANGHIAGFTDIDGARTPFDRDVDLPPGTYWGPLVFLVLKNFDANAEDGRLVFRTIVPTPQPRLLNMEIHREDWVQLPRPGGSVYAERFAMQPTFNLVVDPLIRWFVPDATFFMAPTSPPSLVRFVGPRNYTGQEVRIE